jgi:dTDP-4-dehydrorhamnose 3,5-epimerase-like enzyme
MAKILKIPTIRDKRGSVSILERVPGFDIKRIYYIYDVGSQKRGGHRHKETDQILICVKGSCTVNCENQFNNFSVFSLNSPQIGLLVEASDWHTMQEFSKDCVLLVLASTHYDADDYINERY